MKVRSFVKSASYNPIVRRVVRALHLTRLARSLYYRWALPRSRIYTVEDNGGKYRFYMPTAVELRAMEIQTERHLVRRLLSALRPGDTVWDVGAHLGYWAVQVAKAVGPHGGVVAFEPLSENYNVLLANLELNGLRNVIALRVALGSCRLQERLNRPGPGWTTGHSSLLRPVSGAATYEVVDVAPGDALREERQLPVPRAIKIDVEGYEYFVLQGLQRTLALPACELICCEVHPRLLPPAVTAQTVSGLIELLGFARIDLDFVGGPDPFHVFASKRTGSADR